MRKGLLLASFALVAALLGATLAQGATGGPDDFGYVFIDSESPGGPSFSFESITSTGTLSTKADCDDCVQLDVPMGFAFEYYGTSYTSLGIGTNGILRFDDSDDDECCDDPGPIPSSNVDGPVIFGWWQDWDPGQCGDLYYETKGSSPGRRFIVEWDACHHDSPTLNVACKATFEVILFERSNQILFQYQDVVFSPQGGTCNTAGPHANDNGAHSSVGIQEGPSDGLAYSVNGSRSLKAGLAICFAPPGSEGGPCGDAAREIGGHGRPRVNVGGAVAPLAGLADQARENRERAAAAVAQPAATVQPPRTGTGVTIAPPNTGDAGLAGHASPLWPAMLVLAGGFALAATLRLVTKR